MTQTLVEFLTVFNFTLVIINVILFVALLIHAKQITIDKVTTQTLLDNSIRLITESTKVFQNAKEIESVAKSNADKLRKESTNKLR